jgi:hypothetical protein
MKNIKRLFPLLFAAVVAWQGAVAQETDAASSPDTLVWCGLDYSMVKMIGTKDFRKPDDIFPGFLEKWNSLFMTEMFPKVKHLARSVETDTKAVEPGNAKANAGCIIREDGSRDEMVNASHITGQDIAAVVKGYELKSSKGLGLVFIMDRLVRAQQKGCLYVVFFDISSRKVVYSERLCEKANGAGFRNYWFNPIKLAVGKLPRMYQKAVKAP